MNTFDLKFYDMSNYTKSTATFTDNTSSTDMIYWQYDNNPPPYLVNSYINMESADEYGAYSKDKTPYFTHSGLEEISLG